MLALGDYMNVSPVYCCWEAFISLINDSSIPVLKSYMKQIYLSVDGVKQKI